MLSNIHSRLKNGITICRRLATHSSALPKISREEALKRFIVDKIKATGPITVAEYMKTAVSAPSVGFYGRSDKNREIFGASGDFITAPELTQLFGEMIAVWIYHELASTGHKGSWQLVECGPGSGTLMKDILSVLNKFGEDRVSVHLVETSDALIEKQERTICVDNTTCTFGDSNVIKKNKSRTGVPISWYKNLDDVPESFSVFIVNEFLDALPVHQFIKEQNTWHEIYVNIDKDQLVFMNSKGENIHTRGLIDKIIRNDAERSCYEVCPEAGTYVNQVAERITYNGGFGLIIDYGHPGTRQTLSLRAYSQHKQVHPLSRPGEIDLTADVNFHYLKSLVEDRTLIFGPQTQREFLGQLGIQLRLNRLLQTCREAEKRKIIIDAYNYLMGDMGLKFYAMSIFPKTLSKIMEKRGSPAGFNTGK